MLGRTHREREAREGTRDAIFLLLRRMPHARPPLIDSVWLDRNEAEGYARRRDYHFGQEGEDWYVYAVPANGALAALLAFQDGLPEEAKAQVEDHAGKAQSWRGL